VRWRHAYSNANGNGYSFGVGNTNCDCDCNCNGYRDRNTGDHGNPDCNRYADCHGYGNTDHYGYTKKYPDAETSTNTCAAPVSRKAVVTEIGGRAHGIYAY
jgi:hypothetical protein